MTNRTGPLPALPSTANGAIKTYRNGWASNVFEYRQAQEIRDAFAKHSERIYRTENEIRIE